MKQLLPAALTFKVYLSVAATNKELMSILFSPLCQYFFFSFYQPFHFSDVFLCLFITGFRIWNLVLGRHCDKKCTNENKTITINSTSGRVLVTFQTDTPPPNGAFRGSADDKKLSKFRGFKICYYLKRARKLNSFYILPLDYDQRNLKTLL